MEQRVTRGNKAEQRGTKGKKLKRGNKREQVVTKGTRGNKR